MTMRRSTSTKRSGDSGGPGALAMVRRMILRPTAPRQCVLLPSTKHGMIDGLFLHNICAMNGETRPTNGERKSTDAAAVHVPFHTAAVVLQRRLQSRRLMTLTGMHWLSEAPAKTLRRATFDSPAHPTPRPCAPRQWCAGRMRDWLGCWRAGQSIIFTRSINSRCGMLV